MFQNIEKDDAVKVSIGIGDAIGRPAGKGHRGKEPPGARDMSLGKIVPERLVAPGQQARSEPKGTAQVQYTGIQAQR
ncbi:MAG: hypothetical protein NVS2B16_21400 [Chloroflexota bacterium]